MVGAGADQRDGHLGPAVLAALSRSGDVPGRQLHTAQYPGPEEFAGQRVVVVGRRGVRHAASAGDRRVAAETTWVTRRRPVFREGPFDEDAGRAAVAMVEERVRRGLPPKSVVSVTGLPLNDAVRRARGGVLERLPMFDRITARRV